MSGEGEGGLRSRELRLLVYQRTYWPLFNGQSNHLRTRLRLLPSFGVRPWVITEGREGLSCEDVVDGVTVRRVRPPRCLRGRSVLAEAALCPEFFRRRGAFDVALITSANVAGPFISRVCGRPVIRESVIGEDHAAKFARGLGGRSREWLFRGVDFAVAISPPLAEAYARVGWPAARLELVTSGIDNGVFRPAESAGEVDRLRAELGVPARPAVVFVTVGAVQERKGQLDLVEAWSELTGVGRCEHLVVIGPVNDRAYMEKLERRVRESGLAGRVHFAGRTERVAEYMRCADGFVFGSRNEGLGYVVLEAMSSGLPVAVFDIEGVMSFMITDGVDGLLVRAGDRRAMARAVMTLSEQETKRRALGAAARATALARFSIQKEAEAHARICWRLHNARRGRAAVSASGAADVEGAQGADQLAQKR